MKQPYLPILTIAASALAQQPLAGQQVRGTVVEAATERPVAGAFVRLVDVTDATVASALSSEDGAYVVNAPAAGTFRLDVERIGYQSWTSAEFLIGSGETVVRRLTIPVQAVRLEEISVADPRQCVARAGDPDLVRVWDEVRKALQLNRWAEEHSDIHFSIRRWTRSVDEPGGQILDQNMEPVESLEGDPLIGAAPEVVAEYGWAVSDPGNGWRFFGPSSRTLLSEAFSRTHCFRLMRDESDQGRLLGLAFEPVGTSAVDIAGTLWLDLETAELQHLEYHYTDLYYGGVRQDASGRVDFVRLPTGHWVIRDWAVRMPIPAVPVGADGATPPGASHYRYAGGSLEEVRLPAGQTLDLSESGAVTGVAMDEDGAPEPGAELHFPGTGYRVRADDSGRFRFPAVPRGRYLLVGRHADIAALGGPGTHQTIEVAADGESEVRLRLRPRTETLAELCTSAPPGSGVAYGTVTTTTVGATVVDARIWIAARSAVEQPGAREEWTGIVALSDSLGRYVACGIPDRTRIIAQAGLPTPASDTVHRRVDAASPLRLDFVLTDGRAPLETFARAGRPRDLEAEVDRLLDHAEENSGAHGGTTSLVGTVRSAETGQPLSGAHVTLVGHDDEQVTGVQGTFVFTDLPRQRYRVVTERMGLASDTAEVDLRTGAGTLATLMLETNPVRLPELEVEVERTFHNRRLEGYFKRMKRGLGEFVTREDLEARDILANFRRIPFARIDPCVTALGLSGTDCWTLRLSRGGGSSLDGSLEPCPPLVYIDGMLHSTLLLDEGPPIQNAFTILQQYPRYRLEGIEVYRNPGLAPGQYRMLGDVCGIVLVWTRGR